VPTLLYFSGMILCILLGRRMQVRILSGNTHQHTAGASNNHKKDQGILI
jgi:hypothetical protein